MYVQFIPELDRSSPRAFLAIHERQLWSENVTCPRHWNSVDSAFVASIDNMAPKKAKAKGKKKARNLKSRKLRGKQSSGENSDGSLSSDVGDDTFRYKNKVKPGAGPTRVTRQTTKAFAAAGLAVEDDPGHNKSPKATGNSAEASQVTQSGMTGHDHRRQDTANPSVDGQASQKDQDKATSGGGYHHGTVSEYVVIKDRDVEDLDTEDSEVEDSDTEDSELGDSDENAGMESSDVQDSDIQDSGEDSDIEDSDKNPDIQDSDKNPDIQDSNEDSDSQESDVGISPEDDRLLMEPPRRPGQAWGNPVTPNSPNFPDHILTGSYSPTGEDSDWGSSPESIAPVFVDRNTLGPPPVPAGQLYRGVQRYVNPSDLDIGWKPYRDNLDRGFSEFVDIDQLDFSFPATLNRTRLRGRYEETGNRRYLELSYSNDAIDPNDVFRDAPKLNAGAAARDYYLAPAPELPSPRSDRGDTTPTRQSRHRQVSFALRSATSPDASTSTRAQFEIFLASAHLPTNTSSPALHHPSTNSAARAQPCSAVHNLLRPNSSFPNLTPLPRDDPDPITDNLVASQADSTSRWTLI